MINLINAELARLFKTRSFIILLSAVLFLTAFIIGFLFWDNTQNPSETGIHLDVFFGGYFYIMGTVYAALISLFIGTEFQEKTINNKLICGHSAAEIYISELVVCCAASVIIQILFAALVIVLQLILFGSFRHSAEEIFIIEIKGLLVSLSYCSLILMLCMMTAKKTDSLVLTIFLSFVFDFLSGYVHSELYFSPDKLSSAIKNIYSVLENVLPTGQVQLITDEEHTMSAAKFLLYDALSVCVTSALGIFIFRRKDLK